MSTRIRLAEPPTPVKRALPVLGLARSVAASIAALRSRLAAGASAFETFVDRAVMVALLSAPLAAGAAMGHRFAAAALALAAGLALVAARIFPSRARAIETALSIALAVIGLALAGVAVRAIFR